MKKFMFVALAMILALSAFSAQVLPAYALGTTDRVLVAALSGPAIDGVVPTGDARFASIQGTTSLTFALFSLNLPDGTCLNAAFGRTVVQGIAVRGGQAFAVVPGVPEVHLSEDIAISISPVVGDACGTIGTLAPAPGTVILTGTFQDGSGTK